MILPQLECDKCESQRASDSEKIPSISNSLRNPRLKRDIWINPEWPNVIKHWRSDSLEEDELVYVSSQPLLNLFSTTILSWLSMLSLSLSLSFSLSLSLSSTRKSAPGVVREEYSSLLVYRVRKNVQRITKQRTNADLNADHVR